MGSQCPGSRNPPAVAAHTHAASSYPATSGSTPIIATNCNRLQLVAMMGVAVRVSAKLEEGDFKGAVRLASSDDTLAYSNSHTSSLTSKHPPLHLNSIIPPPSDLSE